MVGMMLSTHHWWPLSWSSGAFDAAAIQRTSVTLMLFALVIPLEVSAYFGAGIYPNIIPPRGD